MQFETLIQNLASSCLGGSRSIFYLPYLCKLPFLAVVPVDPQQLEPQNKLSLNSTVELLDSSHTRTALDCALSPKHSDRQVVLPAKMCICWRRIACFMCSMMKQRDSDPHIVYAWALAPIPPPQMPLRP